MTSLGLYPSTVYMLAQNPLSMTSMGLYPSTIYMLAQNSLPTTLDSLSLCGTISMPLERPKVAWNIGLEGLVLSLTHYSELRHYHELSPCDYLIVAKPRIDIRNSNSFHSVHKCHPMMKICDLHAIFWSNEEIDHMWCNIHTISMDSIQALSQPTWMTFTLLLTIHDMPTTPPSLHSYLYS